jgi:2-keto-4-pentenoate hydratase/2-oxohepta-3-ene-1,7-dioic acid hydratase in catechol pathway
VKFARIGTPGNEIPVVIDEAGVRRDLRSITDEINGDFLSSAQYGDLLRGSLTIDSLPELSGLGVDRVGCPIARPGNVICIGLNYADHAEESGMAIPEEPIVFNKAPNTVVGPYDDVRVPRTSSQTDWEVELGIVIGSTCRYLDSPEDAWSKIAGYVISNDVSERSFQLQRGGQWTKGKSSETFNPCGPWLVSRDEVADVHALSMWLDVNGERMQTGSTATMIFDVPFLVWYLSQFMVLDPGDLINTGTPPGVGMGKLPVRYLRPGDVVELGIEGLGSQRQVVVDSEGGTRSEQSEEFVS